MKKRYTLTGSDTLASWVDRPAELDDEVLLDRLRFRREVGGWLLFRSSYGGRLPDWLVVHGDTARVRRFVEANEQDVVDDLLGLIAASGQDNVERRWGRPESSRESRAWSLNGLINSSPVPTYGLPPGVMGLRFRSMRTMHGGTKLVGLMLVYSDRSQSASTQRSKAVAVFRVASTQLPPSGNISQGLLADNANLEVSRKTERSFVVEGARFTGHTLYVLSQPGSVTYQFDDGRMMLSGYTTRIPEDTVMHLLRRLVELRSHSSVVHTYERELSESETQ